MMKVLGMTEQEAAGLSITMTKAFKMTPKQIKDVSGAMHYLQTKTSLTAGEMGQLFNDFRQIVLMTDKDKRGTVTAQLMAISGVLKDNAIDAQSFARAFTEMADETSSQGRMTASIIGNMTGHSIEEIQRMSLEDHAEMSKLMILATKEAASQGDVAFREFRTQMEGLGVFSREEIYRMRDFADDQIGRFAEVTKEAAAAEERNREFNESFEELRSTAFGLWETMKTGFFTALRPVGLEMAKMLVHVLKPFAEFMKGAAKYMQENKGYAKALGIALTFLASVMMVPLAKG